MSIQTYLRRNIKKQFYYYKHWGKLLLSKIDYDKVSKFNVGERKYIKVKFDKHPIVFNAPFWFLHSVDEIFINEIYKFNSEIESPRIIDCGANIGLSVMYFKKLFPKAKITAYEADPEIFQILKQNIEVYNYSQVELVNQAIYDEETVITFFAEGSVGGRISDNQPINGKSIEVKTTRLKNLLNQQIDFLKIDIEGAEYRVLRDCKDQLSQVQNLFVEYHIEKGQEQALHEVLAWIHEAGFLYYIKEAWNNMSHPFTKKYNDFFQSQLNIFCYRP